MAIHHLLHHFRALSPSSQVHHSLFVHLYANSYLQYDLVALDLIQSFHSLLGPSQQLIEMDQERIRAPDLYISRRTYLHRSLYSDLSIAAIIFYPQICPDLASILSPPYLHEQWYNRNCSCEPSSRTLSSPSSKIHGHHHRQPDVLWPMGNSLERELGRESNYERCSGQDST